MTPGDQSKQAAIRVAATGVLHAKPSLKSKVENAVLSACALQCEIVRHQQKSWASITFHGSRHGITLQFKGDEAILAGEGFLAELPDYEFNIPDQLVADAVVREVDHRPGKMVAEIVLLLSEEV